MGSTSFNYAKSYLKAHATRLKWFSGRLGIENADAIGELVAGRRDLRLLDYGSGKGYQYLKYRSHERWGGILPHCYDIGVWQLKERPTGKFDGVICTDVMEHIDEPDIDRILSDMLGFLHGDRPVFAYFNIFCNPASKFFPDGRNVHLTVRPPKWWEARLSAHRHHNLTIRADYEHMCDHDLQR